MVIHELLSWCGDGLRHPGFRQWNSRAIRIATENDGSAAAGDTTVLSWSAAGEKKEYNCDPSTACLNLIIAHENNRGQT